MKLVKGKGAVEPGQTGINIEEIPEIARKKVIARGTAGTAETCSEYEQGAAGANIYQR